MGGGPPSAFARDEDEPDALMVRVRAISLHIVGLNDEQYSPAALLLLPARCSRATVLQHDQGHVVPVLAALPEVHQEVTRFFTAVAHGASADGSRAPRAVVEAADGGLGALNELDDLEDYRLLSSGASPQPGGARQAPGGGGGGGGAAYDSMALLAASRPTDPTQAGTEARRGHCQFLMIYAVIAAHYLGTEPSRPPTVYISGLFTPLFYLTVYDYVMHLALVVAAMSDVVAKVDGQFVYARIVKPMVLVGVIYHANSLAGVVLEWRGPDDQQSMNFKPNNVWFRAWGTCWFYLLLILCRVLYVLAIYAGRARQTARMEGFFHACGAAGS